MRLGIFLGILLVAFSCRNQDDVGPSLKDKLMGSWRAAMSEKSECTDPEENGISYFSSCPDNNCLEISFLQDNYLAYRQKSETADYYELNGEFHVTDTIVQVCPKGFLPCLKFGVSFEGEQLILTQLDEETGCMIEITFDKK